MLEREKLQDKKRIVIKIGSSSLTHAVSGDLNLQKIEKLVRIISDLKGQGKEVVLVSSGGWRFVRCQNAAFLSGRTGNVTAFC